MEKYSSINWKFTCFSIGWTLSNSMVGQFTQFNFLPTSVFLTLSSMSSFCVFLSFYLLPQLVLDASHISRKAGNHHSFVELQFITFFYWKSIIWPRFSFSDGSYTSDPGLEALTPFIRKSMQHLMNCWDHAFRKTRSPSHNVIGCNGAVNPNVTGSQANTSERDSVPKTRIPTKFCDMPLSLFRCRERKKICCIWFSRNCSTELYKIPILESWKHLPKSLALALKHWRDGCQNLEVKKVVCKA